VAPSWFREERRANPTDTDHYQLLLFNIREMATRIDQDRAVIQENAAKIAAINNKLNALTTDVKEHKAASVELLANFRLSKLLRRWAVAVVVFAGALLTALSQGHELWEHSRSMFTTSP
jgi:hypothetical protein